MLRIKDVSHKQDQDGGSTGRVRHLASAASIGSASVGSASVATVTSATDEERETFLPLPGEIVKLERVA